MIIICKCSAFPLHFPLLSVIVGGSQPSAKSESISDLHQRRSRGPFSCTMRFLLLPAMPTQGGTARCMSACLQTPWHLRCSGGLTCTSLSGPQISAGRCSPTDLALLLFACSQLVVLCNLAGKHLMAKPRLLSVPSSSKAKELACSYVSRSPCFTKLH